MSTPNVRVRKTKPNQNSVPAAAVPIYDSLGESAVEYIVNHSGERGAAPVPCGGSPPSGCPAQPAPMCRTFFNRPQLTSSRLTSPCLIHHTLCAEMCMTLVDTPNLAKYAAAVPKIKDHVKTGAGPGAAYRSMTVGYLRTACGRLLLRAQRGGKRGGQMFAFICLIARHDLLAPALPPCLLPLLRSDLHRKGRRGGSQGEPAGEHRGWGRECCGCNEWGLSLLLCRHLGCSQRVHHGPCPLPCRPALTRASPCTRSKTSWRAGGAWS